MMNRQQRRSVSQRKIDLSFPNPFDALDAYKKKMESIAPSLMDESVPVGKPIELYNIIEEKNARTYEAMRNAGKFPLEDVLAEEPSVAEYIAWLKKGKPQEGEYNKDVSKRCGIIGVKLGMLPYWNEYFQRLPLTVIYVPNCQVIQRKTKEKDGVNALQIGAGHMSMKRVTKPMMGHFARAGVDPKHAITECQVSPDCLLPEGTDLTVRHFSPGQYVDIIGLTKGKGFQGVMKRYGFKGQPASHGVSLTHRSLGSTGALGINRVFKGKKMPGRMGNKKNTQKNNLVYMMDVKRNVIFVKGSVSGANGSYVYLRDAIRKKPENPPYPTFFAPEGEDVSQLADEAALLKAKMPLPAEWRDMDVNEEEAWKQLNPILADFEKDNRLIRINIEKKQKILEAKKQKKRDERDARNNQFLMLQQLLLQQYREQQAAEESSEQKEQ